MLFSGFHILQIQPELRAELPSKQLRGHFTYISNLFRFERWETWAATFASAFGSWIKQTMPMHTRALKTSNGIPDATRQGFSQAIKTDQKQLQIYILSGLRLIINIKLK